MTVLSAAKGKQPPTATKPAAAKRMRSATSEVAMMQSSSKFRVTEEGEEEQWQSIWRISPHELAEIMGDVEGNEVSEHDDESFPSDVGFDEDNVEEVLVSTGE